VISGDADATKAGTAELEELVTAVGGRWQTLEGTTWRNHLRRGRRSADHADRVGTSRSRVAVRDAGAVIQQILRMASENDIDVHVIARRDVSARRPAETAGRPGQIGEGSIGGRRGRHAACSG
jgi:hypothetical protein